MTPSPAEPTDHANDASNAPCTGADAMPRQRCVLWRPADAAAPAALLESLERKGVEVTVVGNDLMAFAHTAAGCAATARLLVLHQPARLPNAGALCVALKRYAPTAVIWVYDDLARPPLREATDTDIAAWEGRLAPPTPVVTVPQRSRTGGPPSLRLTGDDMDAPPRQQAESDADAAAETLSAEELAMLLGNSNDLPPATPSPGQPPLGPSWSNGNGRPTPHNGH